MKNGWAKRMVAVVLLLAVLFLPSCAEAHDPDEAMAALSSLIEASYALNEIYFGEGLPITDDREDVERFYASVDTDVTSVNYHPVAADCGYASEDEIRAATEAVFSESYCSYLFTRAFTGISAVFDEGTEQEITRTATYARYIQYGDVLTVRLNLAEEAIPLNREYDCANATIVQNRSAYVLFSVPTRVDGQPDENVEIRMVWTADGWRLDSPTY